ncbi:MAG: lipid II flippase MurJ, partial [Stellaceae bacterium]
AFSAADTAATASALAAYAAGLPAFVLVKVLAPAFFARHDTKTPVRIAIAAMAVNLCLTVALMQVLAHVGIALATTCAGWVNALSLFLVLVRRGDFRLDRRARHRLPRIAAAAIGMGAVLLLLRLAFGAAIAGSGAARIAVLAGLIGAGMGSFALLTLALGVAEWRQLWGRLRRQPA